jgi:hypothetical protein
VHEETGWLMQEESLRQLGWLHLEHLAPPPLDHPFPHPDFCQIVLAGRAVERDQRDGADWTATDGYEVSSQLMSIDEAWSAVADEPAARVYLPLLAT